jgi:hypothetical protein
VISKNFSLRLVAVAALLGLSGASQAAMTVYTTQASFLAAVTTSGTDSFDNLGIGYTNGFETLSRSAGAYTYDVAATFYTAGTGGDTWLSTDAPIDAIVFNNFGAGVKAAGGLFFTSNVGGNYHLADITVQATDGSGSSTQTIVGSTTGSFLGFVSTGPLTSLVVSAVNPNPLGPFFWPSVNDLTLAAAVPEPETYALLLAGLGVVGFLARRRRA